MTRDFEHIVRTCDIDNWKEALAVSLTYAKADEFANLCGEFNCYTHENLATRDEVVQLTRLVKHLHFEYHCMMMMMRWSLYLFLLIEILGSRLESERHGELAAHACLCYICAGKVDRLVECWTNLSKNSNSPLVLQVGKIMKIKTVLLNMIYR